MTPLGPSTNGAGGERDDPLLDALLDEALGGRQPPDLSARIVQALAARRVSMVASEGVAGADARPLVIRERSERIQRGASGRRFAARHWLSLAASVALLAVGYWTLKPAGPGRPIAQGQIAQKPVAQNPVVGDREQAAADEEAGKGVGADEAVSGAPRVAEGSRASTVAPDHPVATDRQDTPVTDAANTAARDSDVADTEAPDTDAATESPVAPANDLVERAPHESPLPHPGVKGGVSDRSLSDRSAEASVGTHPMSSAVNDEDVVASIDRAIRQRWREQGLRPSPVATDAEWCRRVFLDVIGRIPTIEELESYLVDHARNKRARLLQRLLNDDSYAEAYARHWTAIWTNLLVGRSGGMLPDSPVNREGLQQYLRRSFLTNKPYDKLTYELISAQGSNRPGEDDFNGAVNFVLDNLQEKAATATAKTAQIFLGLQIQCTQCHNHPFNDWKQNRFWELNAFFRQTKAAPERKSSELRLVRLVDEDFAGEGAAHDANRFDPADAEIYYELRNGELRVAYPVFVDGTPIDPSGLVRVVNRRDELARLVVSSEYLGQAIVNRLWAHFFGYGFTKPVDDLGAHNPPSHPELLQELAHDFTDAGYDLKRLVRWITLSEAYSLSSKFGLKQGNQADDPTLGTPPSFSHFYLRQMTVEQLYDSLLVATEAHRAAGNYEEQQRTKDDWAQQFTIAFGTDDNGEATTFDGTITQALMMMNGDLTRRATSSAAGGFLWKVSQRAAQPAAPIKHLYQAALGRKPSKAELKLADELLAARGGNPQTVLEDVWWALLNSNEFILNH
ncbi:MAG TPA: DUF1549 domain-containing protein [Pirellulales bacterium]|jgi:hypothetical protein|nr:DUF1549 domain-containing protein [Pirellulales bacterium]